MQTSTLLRRNLTHYWRTNLAVVLGAATAVAVLAGALLVGDSVRASLRSLFLQRLGRTDSVLTSSGFFRERLAAEVGPACPLIALQGIVTHQESGRRASGVHVYGIDDRFWKFHGLDPADRALTGRQVFLSPGLAQELQPKPGEGILVRVQKPSAIPLESVHGRKDNLGETVRFSFARTLNAAELGEFSLRAHQGVVRAVFIPLRRLQEEIGQPGRVNALLLETGAGGESALREKFALEDLGIRLGMLAKRKVLVLETDSILVPDVIAEKARAAATRLGMRSQGVFTYLANTIQVGERTIPYSLVSAIEEEMVAPSSPPIATASGPSPVVLNDWAARELSAKPNDTVSLEYYLWNPDGGLSTGSAQFQLKAIVPITGAAADPDLAPQYPGISDAGDLDDWDPPFPIDLKRIRPSDEDYWDRYRTTPKAFILLEKGQELWQSRFGKLTSLRIVPPPQDDLAAALAAYRATLRTALDPLESGMTITAIRAQGLEASRGATDFSEYFVYFSFFLVVSALLLSALFFKLGVEQRLREIGLLRAVGFSIPRIRSLFLREGALLAVLGSVAGVGGGVAYAALMMYGLRTWWVDAVGTRSLSLDVTPLSLLAGAAGGLLTAVACIAWTLRGIQPVTPRGLLTGEKPLPPGSAKPRIAAPACAVAGLALLAASAAGLIPQAGGFFGAGALLLASALFFQWIWLSRSPGQVLSGSVVRLGFRNAAHRPGRSILSVALIASAIFILVAVDAFRRPVQAGVLDKQSGTGGYPLLADSLLPLVDLTELRRALGDAPFVPFRLRPGDDASCLNLYQPRNPRILAPPGGFLQAGRFRFASSLARTPEEKANPWLLLLGDPSDGTIPAIADANSLAYVLHRKLGDILDLNGVRLRMVASLDHSIFQGEILIAEKHFTRIFPGEQGFRFFLLDAPIPDIGGVEDALADFGFDISGTAERLASFDRVENTYLSTFQTLGGLGLLLGTVGLAAILLRNVLERRRELALLQAVGYRPRHLTIMVIAENALLLLLGLATGTACALLAIAPAFFARGGRISALSMGLLLLGVVLTGMAASIAAVAAAIRSPLLATLRAE